MFLISFRGRLWLSQSVQLSHRSFRLDIFFSQINSIPWNSIYKTNFSRALSLHLSSIFFLISLPRKTLTPTSRPSSCFECQITTIGFIVFLSHSDKQCRTIWILLDEIFELGMIEKIYRRALGGKIRFQRLIFSSSRKANNQIHKNEFPIFSIFTYSRKVRFEFNRSVSKFGHHIFIFHRSCFPNRNSVDQVSNKLIAYISAQNNNFQATNGIPKPFPLALPILRWYHIYIEEWIKLIDDDEDNDEAKAHCVRSINIILKATT